MTTKINFSSKTVAVSASFSFDEMAVMQEMLTISAMEAAEERDAEKLGEIKSIAERLGIELDIDIEIEEPADNSHQNQQEVPERISVTINGNNHSIDEEPPTLTDEAESDALKPGEEPHSNDGEQEVEGEEQRHSKDE